MYSPRIIQANRLKLEATLGFPLRDYSLGEVDEFTYRLRDIDWTPGISQVLPNLPEEVQAFIVNDLHLSKVDFRYWANRYCNPPDTPILLPDGSFKPIGDLLPGDTVLGWAKSSTVPKSKGIRSPIPFKEALTPSKVLATQRRKAPLVKVTMASGRVFHCTPDHKWSSGHTNKNGRPWISVEPGKILRKVVDPPPPIPEELKEDAIWLGGMFDGEGTWTRSGFSISQSSSHNSHLFSELRRALSRLGFKFTEADDKFYVLGGRQAVVKFLNWCKPRRKQPIKGFMFCERDIVISVEPAGEGEVISMQTETGNYIAHGYASKNCYILGDDKRLVRMAEFWPGQERLLSLLAREEEKQTDKGKPVKIRNVMLKSRQIGGTVISEALGAHMTFLQPRTQSIVGSDHPDNTLKLWQTLLRIYDNLPGWMRPLPDSKPKATNLHFPELDSDIVYGSGNQRTTLGQGMTVDFAHLTEVSSWQYPYYLDEDLLPAFDSSRKHHTLIILESTGAGAKGNWFHDKFMAAWENQNDFTQLFIGWFYRPTWRADAENFEPDAETLKLARKVKETHGVTLDQEQMSWWQGKRKAYTAEGKLEIFYQEFPSVIEEAFQTGFVSAFPIECRASLRRGVQKPQDVYEFVKETKKLKKLSTEEFWQSEEKSKWDNKLVVWERKKPGNMYVVGVDASYGVGGDNAVVEVLRVGNKIQPDEQVAEYCGDIDPLLLAEVSWIVGHVFCEGGSGYPAKLAIEVNPGSPGIVTQTELLRRGYPHFFRWKRPLRTDGQVSKEVGWWTTPGSRPLLTERGQKAIIEGSLLINSPEFVKEMDTFVNTGLDRVKGVNKKMLEAAPGYHDDRIMSLFIALEVAHWDDMINLSEERRKFWEQRSAPPESSVQFNTLLEPWEDLVEKWESSLVDPW